MSRLLKNGLVEVDGVEPGGGPERKRYAITDAGRHRRRSGGSPQPEKPEPYLQTTLYTKVVLALLTGRERRRRARHPARRAPAADARASPTASASGDLADQLICDHALFHLEADLRWLELTAARLDQLAEGGASRMTPAGSLLVADDLRKSYGPTPALDGAEFSIHPGEVVAVMGPSGSGKSTLLHCLAGIVPPDAGSITLRRPRAGRHVRRRAQRAAPHRVRVRLPVRPARAGADLPGERGPAAAAERRQRKEAERHRAGLDGAPGGRRRRAASGPARSPAARASGSPWPAPWSPARG